MMPDPGMFECFCSAWNSHTTKLQARYTLYNRDARTADLLILSRVDRSENLCMRISEHFRTNVNAHKTSKASKEHVTYSMFVWCTGSNVKSAKMQNILNNTQSQLMQVQANYTTDKTTIESSIESWDVDGRLATYLWISLTLGSVIGRK